MRSDTVRTRAAFRTARGTTRRNVVRSFQPISDGSRANDTSWTVTTHGQGGRNGSACCVWESEAPILRSARGSDPGHAELLRARAELVRLDAVGNELRVAGDGDEANPGFRRERPELAEEVERVRLVPCPLSPEHVRIEGDHLHASSRQTSTTASAV